MYRAPTRPKDAFCAGYRADCLGSPQQTSTFGITGSAVMTVGIPVLERLYSCVGRSIRYLLEKSSKSESETGGKTAVKPDKVREVQGNHDSAHLRRRYRADRPCARPASTDDTKQQSVFLVDFVRKEDDLHDVGKDRKSVV